VRISVPDGLALSRIAFVPVIMALILYGVDDPTWKWVAVALTIIASLTDMLDGYLARKWNITTTLGAFLDTTADKLLVAGLLYALVGVGRTSAWIGLVMIARELIVMGLRGLAAMEGTLIKPSIWGKIKATLQFIALPLAIARLGPTFAGFYFDEWMMTLAAVAAILSGWNYLAGFWGVVKEDAPAA
jgi:CDP-diacylglycerol--glycerol-3-phosphate 3-phosphatidyltransferase